MQFYNTKIFSHYISLIRKHDFEHGAKNVTFLLTRYILQYILPQVFFIILFDLFDDLQYILRFYVSFNTISM